MVVFMGLLRIIYSQSNVYLEGKTHRTSFTVTGHNGQGVLFVYNGTDGASVNQVTGNGEYYFDDLENRADNSF